EDSPFWAEDRRHPPSEVFGIAANRHQPAENRTGEEKRKEADDEATECRHEHLSVAGHQMVPGKEHGDESSDRCNDDDRMTSISHDDEKGKGEDNTEDGKEHENCPDSYEGPQH